ncbi:sensory box sensor histidine kinase [Dehalogenimonas sp. WBC-2]|nr:sensory box sensor histidine kinase [Dehalogenimonas sp. WBC-2]
MTDKKTVQSLNETPEKRRNIPSISPSSTSDLETELRVYQAELEMQNEMLRETEDHLEESNAVYHQLFNLSPMPYFVIDSNLTITIANNAGAELLDKTPSELIGERFSRFIVPDFQDSFHHCLAGLSGKKLRNLVDTVITLDDKKQINVEIIAARTGATGLNYLIAVIDITERRQNVFTLRELKLLDNALDCVNAQVVYLDTNFNFILVNTAYAKVCGYPKEFFPGKNHFVLYPDDENEAIFRRVRDSGVAETYSDKPFEFPGHSEHGVTYWDWTLTPVKSFSGAVEGLVFSLTETTQRVKAAKVLQTVSEQLEDQVRSRTAELEDVNQQLALEMARRTLAKDELRALSRRLVELEEAERRRISQELHDEVGQHLTLLKMILDTGRRNNTMGKTAIESAIEQTNQVITQVRDLSLQLHPAMLDVLGLSSTLKALFQRLKDSSGLMIAFDGNIDDTRLNPDLRLCAYRVTQEALTNILRYADVNEAAVRLTDKKDHFCIAISDKGKGFDWAKLTAGKSSGISSMRERIMTFNGRFRLETGVGLGTLVEVELPYSIDKKQSP